MLTAEPLLKFLNSPFSLQEGINRQVVALTYCKTLVEMHGGTIRFESAVENPDDPLSPHGTKVIISLRIGSDHLPPECVNMPIGELQGNPLKQFHQSVMEELAHCQWGWVGSAVGPDPEASFVNALLGSTKDEVPTTSPSVYFSPTDVVFIVDDEVETRRYLREIFQPFCKVVEFTNGAEALEKTKTMPPDLIIADAVLPQVSENIWSSF